MKSYTQKYLEFSSDSKFHDYLKREYSLSATPGVLVCPSSGIVSLPSPLVSQLYQVPALGGTEKLGAEKEQGQADAWRMRRRQSSGVRALSGCQDLEATTSLVCAGGTGGSLIWLEQSEPGESTKRSKRRDWRPSRLPSRPLQGSHSRREQFLDPFVFALKICPICVLAVPHLSP